MECFSGETAFSVSKESFIFEILEHKTIFETEIYASPESYIYIYLAEIQVLEYLESWENHL